MNDQAKPQQEFAIQRIYVKDLSFESPLAPEVFREEWKPEVGLDLGSKAEALDDDHYHVILTATATVKKGDKTLFLAEVQQAGIFGLGGFEGEQLEHLLGSFCPSILFPYLREVVSEASTRGGFPPLYLAPVNFDALYEENKRTQAEKQSETA